MELTYAFCSTANPMEPWRPSTTPARSAARSDFTKARTVWSARTARLRSIRRRSGRPADAIPFPSNRRRAVALSRSLRPTCKLALAIFSTDMFWRLLLQSFRRQKRSKLLAIAAVTLGVAVATAMITIATDVGDKINRELRSFGANIAVYPEASDLRVNVGDVSIKPQAAQLYLNESDLPKIKSIFWRHNILAFAPFLDLQTTLSTANGSRPVEVVGTYFAKQLHYGDETFTTG